MKSKAKVIGFAASIMLITFVLNLINTPPVGVFQKTCAVISAIMTLLVWGLFMFCYLEDV